MNYDLERMKDLFCEELAALEERMSKKQDNTDKTLVNWWGANENAGKGGTHDTRLDEAKRSKLEKDG